MTRPATLAHMRARIDADPKDNRMDIPPEGPVWPGCAAIAVIASIAVVTLVVLAFL